MKTKSKKGEVVNGMVVRTKCTTTTTTTTPPPPPPKGVIDLTLLSSDEDEVQLVGEESDDDYELQRAIRLSLSLKLNKEEEELCEDKQLDVCEEPTTKTVEAAAVATQKTKKKKQKVPVEPPPSNIQSIKAQHTKAAGTVAKKAKAVTTALSVIKDKKDVVLDTKIAEEEQASTASPAPPEPTPSALTSPPFELLTTAVPPAPTPPLPTTARHRRVSTSSKSFYLTFSRCFGETCAFPQLANISLADLVPAARKLVKQTHQVEISSCLDTNTILPPKRMDCALNLPPLPSSTIIAANPLIYMINGHANHIQECVMPYLPPIPTQNTWIPLHKNVPAPDETLLRYIFYFGDHDNEDLFAGVYAQEDVNTQGKNLAMERMAALYEADDQVIEQYLLHSHNDEVGLEQALNRPQVPAAGGARKGKDLDCEDANETFEVRINRVLIAMRRRSSSSSAAAAQVKPPTTEAEVFDSYRSIFCRLCLKYDCYMHEMRPKNLQVFEWDAQRDAFLALPASSTQLCGPACHLQPKPVITSAQLTPKQVVMCAKLQVCLETKTNCEIAAMLRLECAKVRLAVSEQLTAERSAFSPKLTCHLDGSSLRLAQTFSTDHEFAKQHEKSQNASATACRINRLVKNGELPDAGHNACAHMGPCGPNNPHCSCQSTFCSKHCMCSAYCFQDEEDDEKAVCKNLFSGCQCEPSKCQTKHCPCFHLDRACDPDLCHAGQSNSMGEGVCVNCNYVPKRLLLAESTVPNAGWGVFARNAIRKDEFISEYIGELISQDEAERRGTYCDKVNRSYLFNVNADQVVDAFRKGNKIRFANHDKKSGNCMVKMMTVNRQHRIFLLARRDIKAGEELFFDYGWERELKAEGLSVGANTEQKWYKKASAAKRKSAKDDDDDFTTTVAAASAADMKKKKRPSAAGEESKKKRQR